MFLLLGCSSSVLYWWSSCPCEVPAQGILDVRLTASTAVGEGIDKSRTYLESVGFGLYADRGSVGPSGIQMWTQKRRMSEGMPLCRCGPL